MIHYVSKWKLKTHRWFITGAMWHGNEKMLTLTVHFFNVLFKYLFTTWWVSRIYFWHLQSIFFNYSKKECKKLITRILISYKYESNVQIVTHHANAHLLRRKNIAFTVVIDTKRRVTWGIFCSRSRILNSIALDDHTNGNRNGWIIICCDRMNMLRVSPMHRWIRIKIQLNLHDIIVAAASK